MTSSLSNLVDNLTEGTHKIICNDCDCFLENLFCFKKKSFESWGLRSIWMNGKSLMKHHYLEKGNLQQLKYGKYYRCRLHTKMICKDL